MDALESAKSAGGGAGEVRKFQVKLHHLLARNSPGICHRDGSLQRVAGIDRGIRQSEVAVAESGIAQAISKRPERLAFEVTVGASLHRVVLEVRQLVNIFIEGD